jgi:hypothetical protein
MSLAPALSAGVANKKQGLSFSARPFSLSPYDAKILAALLRLPSRRIIAISAHRD